MMISILDDSKHFGTCFWDLLLGRQYEIGHGRVEEHWLP